MCMEVFLSASTLRPNSPSPSSRDRKGVEAALRIDSEALTLAVQSVETLLLLDDVEAARERFWDAVCVPDGRYGIRMLMTEGELFQFAAEWESTARTGEDLDLWGVFVWAAIRASLLCGPEELALETWDTLVNLQDEHMWEEGAEADLGQTQRYEIEQNELGCPESSAIATVGLRDQWGWPGRRARQIIEDWLNQDWWEAQQHGDDA